MLFLLDSNVAIAGDPLSIELDAGTPSAAEFLRLAALHHHDLRAHPASLKDFARISDSDKRAARLALFNKYRLIDGAPPISGDQVALLGQPVSGSNDEVDQELLATIKGDAAEYLVSDDLGLHARARRLGIADRVLTLVDAAALLRALHVPLPEPPPSVRRVKAHELNLNDPIFDSLKLDYTGFAHGLSKSVDNSATLSSSQEQRGSMRRLLSLNARWRVRMT